MESSEGYFNGGEGAKISENLMNQLHEMKNLKVKDSDIRIASHNYINPCAFLERYESSLKEDYTAFLATKPPSYTPPNYLYDEEGSDKENQNSVETDNDDEVIENSFEKTSSPAINLDDIPVTNIVQDGRTFEQVLEEQLQKEQQKNQSNTIDKVATPKKTFLRKGQGTARFKGPPAKGVTRPRKPGKKIGFQLELEDKEEPLNNDEVPVTVEPVSSKPPVRKTARLNRREPIKKLNLIPLQTSTKDNESNSRPVIQRSLAPSQPKEDPVAAHTSYNDEEAWSDPNDTVVTLETTAIENILKEPSDPNQTSNETFEQMEHYCNKYFDADDSDPIDLDAEPVLRMDAAKKTAAPSNMLMQKLFPSLKPKPVVKKSQKPEPKTFQPEFYADPDQPKPESGAILKSKLEELESELKRFRKENAALEKSKAEHQSGVDELKKQVEEFQKLKSEELNNIDQYRKNERAKLKKDRRMFEDYVNTTKKNMPTKEDKETIRELEERVEQVRDESKLKEQRLSAVNSRLRGQVDMLSTENVSLKNMLEALQEKVAKLEKEAERRKAKESNRMWKEINDIVDNCSFANTSSQTNQVEIVECNLPVTRYVKDEETKPKRKNALPKVVRCQSHNEKKKETKLADGRIEIIYFNDTRKIISADGSSSETFFSNGDIRTIMADGSETYFYKSSSTKRTTLKNGVQIIEFNNEQVERHFLDGSKHITFPDGSSKLVRQDGYEETTLHDGTCMKVHPNGDKTINFPNGQREIHTNDFKRREYPDGTSKTVFSDGRQETRYASGRLRVKDPSGRVVIDSMLTDQNAVKPSVD